jgi:hypothetical protein
MTFDPPWPSEGAKGVQRIGLLWLSPLNACFKRRRHEEDGIHDGRRKTRLRSGLAIAQDATSLSPVTQHSAENSKHQLRERKVDSNLASVAGADPVGDKLEKLAPDHWIKAFRGTPLSIVVPPLIRFLYGLLALQSARVFLQTALVMGEAGEPHLARALKGFEKGGTAKNVGVTLAGYFACTHIIILVSEVEHFFAHAVSASLRLYPEKMGGQAFKLSEIISASSTDELIDRAAKATFNSLMYEKPLDYVRKLAEILSIDSARLEELWPTFVELKARRDLGVHNNWIVNEIYLRKLKEAKVQTTLKLGESATPDDDYVATAITACQRLVERIANLLGEKWIPVSDTSAGVGQSEEESKEKSE